MIQTQICSERERNRADSGLNRQLDHERFYTRYVECTADTTNDG